MWKEFKSHFRNENRDLTLEVNHRDFMTKSIDLNRARYNQTIDSSSQVGERYLSHDHRRRVRESYRKLMATSVEVPKQRSILKDPEELIKRARYRD
jgi:hypothetical protein